MSDLMTSMPRPSEEYLLRLIYCSVSTEPINDSLAQSILEQARENNDRLGITGMLLADEKLFVQYLEGEARHVKAVFKKILQDKRHRCVVELLRQPNAQERQYPKWSMAWGNAYRMPAAARERQYPKWSMAWGRASRQEIRAIVEDAKTRLQTGEFTPWAPAVSLLAILLDSEFRQEYGLALASAALESGRAAA